MATSEIVLDTSVVVKFLVKELDSESADRLLEQFRSGLMRFVVSLL